MINSFCTFGENVMSLVHGMQRPVTVLYESLDVIAFYNEMAPNEMLQPQRHDVAEIIYRISGETEHTVSNESFVVKPGMRVLIPVNALHFCRVIGNTPVKQITLLVRDPIDGSFFFS